MRTRRESFPASTDMSGPELPGVIPKVAGGTPGGRPRVCGALWWLSLMGGGRRERGGSDTVRPLWGYRPPLQWERDVRPEGGGHSCGLAVDFYIKKRPQTLS